MRTLVAGFSGWARMRGETGELRRVDTAITITGTLLLVLTWAMLRA